MPMRGRTRPHSQSHSLPRALALGGRTVPIGGGGGGDDQDEVALLTRRSHSFHDSTSEASNSRSRSVLTSVDTGHSDKSATSGASTGGNASGTGVGSSASGYLGSASSSAVSVRELAFQNDSDLDDTLLSMHSTSTQKRATLSRHKDSAAGDSSGSEHSRGTVIDVEAPASPTAHRRRLLLRVRSSSDPHDFLATPSPRKQHHRGTDGGGVSTKQMRSASDGPDAMPSRTAGDDLGYGEKLWPTFTSSDSRVTPRRRERKRFGGGVRAGRGGGGARPNSDSEEEYDDGDSSATAAMLRGHQNSTGDAKSGSVRSRGVSKFLNAAKSSKLVSTNKRKATHTEGAANENRSRTASVAGALARRLSGAGANALGGALGAHHHRSRSSGSVVRHPTPQADGRAPARGGGGTEVYRSSDNGSDAARALDDVLRSFAAHDVSPRTVVAKDEQHDSLSFEEDVTIHNPSPPDVSFARIETVADYDREARHSISHSRKSHKNPSSSSVARAEDVSYVPRRSGQAASEKRVEKLLSLTKNRSPSNGAEQRSPRTAAGGRREGAGAGSDTLASSSLYYDERRRFRPSTFSPSMSIRLQDDFEASLTEEVPGAAAAASPVHRSHQQSLSRKPEHPLHEERRKVRTLPRDRGQGRDRDHAPLKRSVTALPAYPSSAPRDSLSRSMSSRMAVSPPDLYDSEDEYPRRERGGRHELPAYDDRRQRHRHVGGGGHHRRQHSSGGSGSGDSSPAAPGISSRARHTRHRSSPSFLTGVTSTSAPRSSPPSVSSLAHDPQSGVSLSFVGPRSRAMFDLLSKRPRFLQSFSRLRNARDFSRNRFRSKESIQREILTHQREPMKKTLLKYTKDHFRSRTHKALLKDSCLQNFRDTLSVCYSTSLDDHISAGLSIIDRGRSFEELRDEVYAHILKQVALNEITRLPQMDTTLRLWKLMYLCLCHFPPSPEMSDIILSYVVQLVYPNFIEISFADAFVMKTPMDVAICCFYTWRHTCALGPMKEPPTREKVLQVFAKNQASDYLDSPSLRGRRIMPAHSASSSSLYPSTHDTRHAESHGHPMTPPVRPARDPVSTAGGRVRRLSAFGRSKRNLLRKAKSHHNLARAAFSTTAVVPAVSDLHSLSRRDNVPEATPSKSKRTKAKDVSKRTGGRSGHHHAASPPLPRSASKRRLRLLRSRTHQEIRRDDSDSDSDSDAEDGARTRAVSRTLPKGFSMGAAAAAASAASASRRDFGGGHSRHPSVPAPSTSPSFAEMIAAEAARRSRSAETEVERFRNGKYSGSLDRLEAMRSVPAPQSPGGVTYEPLPTHAVLTRTVARDRDADSSGSNSSQRSRERRRVTGHVTSDTTATDTATVIAPLVLSGMPVTVSVNVTPTKRATAAAAAAARSVVGAPGATPANVSHMRKRRQHEEVAGTAEMMRRRDAVVDKHAAAAAAIGRTQGLSRRALKAYARSRQETRNFLSDERMALLSKAFPDTYLAVLLDANSHVVSSPWRSGASPRAAHNKSSTSADALRHVAEACRLSLQQSAKGTVQIENSDYVFSSFMLGETQWIFAFYSRVSRDHRAADGAHSLMITDDTPLERLDLIDGIIRGLAADVGGFS